MSHPESPSQPPTGSASKPPGQDPIILGEPLPMAPPQPGPSRKTHMPVYPTLDLPPESDDDLDEDLEEPSWDGIRRRKRTTGRDGQPGRIRPAYYYPCNDTSPVSSGYATKQKSRGIPVFEPTMDEFRDFYQYIQKIDDYGMRSGVVKVVPPKEWLDSLPDVQERLKRTRIRTPIAELLHGATGLFRQTNITKSRQWDAKQWKELSETPKYAMPDFFGTGDPVELAEQQRRRKQSNSASKKRKRNNNNNNKKANEDEEPEANVKDEQEEESVMQPHPNGKGGPAAAQPVEEDDKASSAGDHQSPPGEVSNNNNSSTSQTSTPKPQPNTDHSPVTNGTAKKENGDVWEGFDYKSMMHGLRTDHFTVDNCSDVEKRYWRTLTFGEPPMYGADLEGSLFTKETTSWNVANLRDLLQQLSPHSRIPGVTQPYLYFGMWRATFSWHVEDADLYSINYVHFGAPKFWYSVPQAQAERFERVMANFFPTDRKKCPQFLRHKSYLASPKKLAEQGVTLNRCVQHAGEFMITYPRGYHSGFNVGFNCAESINFATERWLDYGRVSRACKCVDDSVRLNVDSMLADARRDGQTDPTILEAIPEKYRDGPISEEPTFLPPLKRQRVDNTEALEQAEQKRLFRASVKAAKDAEAAAKTARKEEKAQAQQAAVAAAQQRQSSFCCVLCPDTTQKSLVKLGKAPPGQASDPRRKAGHAHKICVMFTPGTYLDVDPVSGEERVYGLEDVEKARWNLKCQLCSEKHGTKVQCTKSAKCVKAYHVTCTLKEGSGVFIDAVIGEAPSTVSLIESAREEGSSIMDVFADMPAAGTVSLPEDEQGAEAAAPPPVQVTSPQKSLVDKAAAKDPAALQTALTAAAQPQPAQPAAETPQTAELPQNGEDAIDSIKLVVLCRVHNPEWTKAQALIKLNILCDKAKRIPLESYIKVKTSGGIFQVRLMAVLEDRHSVQVAFEDGKLSSYKVTAVLWDDGKTPSAAAATPSKRPYNAVSPSEAAQRVAATATLPPPPPVNHSYPAGPLPSMVAPGSDASPLSMLSHASAYSSRAPMALPASYHQNAPHPPYLPPIGSFRQHPQQLPPYAQGYPMSTASTAWPAQPMSLKSEKEATLPASRPHPPS